MPLCSLEQFLAEQLSGSTFKVLLDVMFLYSRNALKVAFLDGGSWFFFTSHKSASLGKKPKINKDYSIYRFLFPAIVPGWLSVDPIQILTKLHRDLAVTFDLDLYKKMQWIYYLKYTYMIYFLEIRSCWVPKNNLKE